MVPLSKPIEGSESKQTKYKHLEAVWAKTGIKPDELAAIPTPPTELLYLWRWLRELAYPMAYAELQAWEVLTGRKLSLWEVDAMIRLDRVRSDG